LIVRRKKKKGKEKRRKGKRKRGTKRSARMSIIVRLFSASKERGRGGEKKEKERKTIEGGKKKKSFGEMVGCGLRLGRPVVQKSVFSGGGEGRGEGGGEKKERIENPSSLHSLSTIGERGEKKEKVKKEGRGDTAGNPRTAAPVLSEGEKGKRKKGKSEGGRKKQSRANCCLLVRGRRERKRGKGKRGRASVPCPRPPTLRALGHWQKGEEREGKERGEGRPPRGGRKVEGRPFTLIISLIVKEEKKRGREKKEENN